MIDRGSVRRSVRHKMLGRKHTPEQELVDEAQLAELNRSHSTFVLGLVCFLVALMAIGIVQDISSGIPRDATASFLQFLN